MAAGARRAGRWLFLCAALWGGGCGEDAAPAPPLAPPSPRDPSAEGEDELDTLLTPARPGADAGPHDWTREDAGVDAEPPDGGTSSGSVVQACYPGADRAWDACLPLVPEAAPAQDYAYPPPLNGVDRYRAPARFLDLDAHPEDLPLAPNFVLSELAQRRKGRYAVLQPHAVGRLQTLRDRVGPIVVTSGYRSPAYNASVGGAEHSRHMYGDGFDLKPQETDLETLARHCADVDGFLVEYETHVHCDFRNFALDEVFFDTPEAAAQAAVGYAAELVVRGRTLTARARGFDEGAPRIRWRARDRRGEVCAAGEGARFVAPPCAVEVVATIGAVLERGLSLAP